MCQQLSGCVTLVSHLIEYVMSPCSEILSSLFGLQYKMKPSSKCAVCKYILPSAYFSPGGCVKLTLAAKGIHAASLGSFHI